MPTKSPSPLPYPFVFLGLCLALVLLTVPLAHSAKAQSPAIQVETLASGLELPWGLAFLPDGRFLVTEKRGALRVIGKDGTLSAPITGLPEIKSGGQGGLLDIALAPDFAASGLVFFTFSEPGGLFGSGTALARGVLDLGSLSLSEVTVLFSQDPKTSGGRHFGSRIVFGRDGTVFITTGDRGERDQVQDSAIHRGQVIRVAQDGSIPADNPFVGVKTHRAETFSLGHRNPQGAALHPETGDLWVVEHGARGGDEVNKVQAGKNYGWPVISYGRHYSGLSIGEGTVKEGMEQPIHYWDPSIAPSGMMFYMGEAFPAWHGDLFVGALRGQALVRLDMDGEAVLGEERLLTDLRERIRDVRQGPDGLIYLLTDSGDGRLIRLSPKP